MVRQGQRLARPDRHLLVCVLRERWMLTRQLLQRLLASRHSRRGAHPRRCRRVCRGRPRRAVSWDATRRTDSRHEATPQLWQETYLSALLRAIRYADDASYRLAGYRKMDPITTIEGEQRFLKAAEDMFFSGWHLGSDPEVQVATIVSNHLTAGIIKYFADSYRLEQAANLFERIYQKEPEVAALLAQSYIGMSELTVCGTR